MKNILCIFTAVGLSACATPGINSSFSSKSIQAGKGVLIVSVTNNNANYLNGVNQFAPKLTFVDSVRGEEVVLDGSIGTAFDKHIMNDKNWVIGRVIAVEVSAGKYKFKSFSTPEVALHIQARSIEAIPLCFTVAPGEVVYVGNLDLFLSSNNPSYRLNISDKTERDFSHVKEKWPNLPTNTIAKRLAESSC